MKLTACLAAALALTPAALAAQDEALWVGSADVRVERIRPGTEVVEMTVTVDGEPGHRVTQTEEIAFVSWDGKDLLRQTVRLERDGKVVVTDTTFYDAGTLAPMHHASHAPPRRELTLSYSGARVTGRVSREGGAPEEIDVALDHEVFDPSASLLLVRALPLDEGYRVRIPLLNQERLEGMSMGVSVIGTEWIETAQGEQADTYVVSISYEGLDGWAKYWITKESRLLVKTESAFGEGRALTGWARFTPAGDETDVSGGR